MHNLEREKITGVSLPNSASRLNNQPQEHDPPMFPEIAAWLVAHSVSPKRTGESVGYLNDFIRNTSSDFDRPVYFGVTGKALGYGAQHVWLSLLWPTSFDLESLKDTRRANEISSRFTHQVGLRLPQDVSFHLEFATLKDRSLQGFKSWLRDICSKDGTEYLCVFKCDATGVRFPNQTLKSPRQIRNK